MAQSPHDSPVSASDLRVLITLMKEQQDRLNHLIENPPGINKMYMVVIGALWVITMGLIGLTYNNLAATVAENSQYTRRIPVIENTLSQHEKAIEALERKR